ncbi:MAG: TonB-dependent receptor, partial [Xanthomonadaceae bacterium]|nr:TonB-dependent receptor [Xanthomonadaceae bacterium]
MNHRQNRGRADKSVAPQRRRLVAACATAWLFAAPGAVVLAQDASGQPPSDQAQPKPAAQQGVKPASKAGKQKKTEASQLGAVVVNGISSSIQSALDTKRDSDDIVEAISAEDIGKLPDVSIADSLARLPGLATQRVNG